MQGERICKQKIADVVVRNSYHHHHHYHQSLILILCFEKVRSVVHNVELIHLSLQFILILYGICFDFIDFGFRYHYDNSISEKYSDFPDLSNILICYEDFAPRTGTIRSY